MDHSKLHFLVADDHPLTRAGIVQVLLLEFPHSLCKEVSSLQSARQCMQQQVWDLVLLDQNFPDGKGIDFLAQNPSRSPVMLLTMYDDRELCLMAQDAGACGFLSKGDDPRFIVEAIRKVIGGGRHFPQPKSKVEGILLSQRERELLALLLAGHRAADIAREWMVSQTTVQSYRNRLFLKFGVDNLADLIKEALNRGLT